MFEYTHVVIDSKGGEWGAFQNAGMAKIMRDALIKKFSHSPEITFNAEAIS